MLWKAVIQRLKAYFFDVGGSIYYANNGSEIEAI